MNLLFRPSHATKKYQLAAMSPARPTTRSLSTQTRNINSPSHLKIITLKKYAKFAPPTPIPTQKQNSSKFRLKFRDLEVHHAQTLVHLRLLTHVAHL